MSELSGTQVMWAVTQRRGVTMRQRCSSPILALSNLLLAHRNSSAAIWIEPDGRLRVVHAMHTGCA
jgi:hypothetical protein